MLSLLKYQSLTCIPIWFWNGREKGMGYSRKCAQFTVDQSYAGEGYLTSVPWWKWDEKIIQKSIYLVIPCYSQEWLTLPRRFFGKADSQLPPPDLQNLNLHPQRDSHVIHRNIKFWESKWHPYSFKSCWGLRVPDTWNATAISSLGQHSPASAGRIAEIDAQTPAQTFRIFWSGA